MKAKEYAEQYKKSVDGTEGEENKTSQVKAIGVVLRGLIMEFKELTETRGKKSNAAYYACWKEINAKWVAFTNLITPKDGYFPYHPGGLRRFINQEFPELGVSLGVLEDMQVSKKARKKRWMN